MELDVILEEQDEGGYTIYVPLLPGCVSEGDSREEAIKNIKEAIALYLESSENALSVYEGKGESIKIKI